MSAAAAAIQEKLKSKFDFFSLEIAKIRTSSFS